MVEFEKLQDIDVLNITLDVVRMSVVIAAVHKDAVALVRPRGKPKSLNGVEFKPLKAVSVVYL